MNRKPDAPARPGPAGTEVGSVRRGLLRTEWERAAELGLFPPGERLELIGGEVIRKMSPQGSLHASAIRRTLAVVQRIAGDGRMVDVQLPLALAEDSEPEPDLAVIAGNPGDYGSGHPKTALLVVEVADFTLAFDRSEKGSLYAAAAIPEYWILDLPDRVLEVHRDPAVMARQPFGYHYRSITRHPEGDEVVPLFASGATVPVADLLP